jgi:hypothetical protein
MSILSQFFKHEYLAKIDIFKDLPYLERGKYIRSSKTCDAPESSFMKLTVSANEVNILEHFT